MPLFRFRDACPADFLSSVLFFSHPMFGRAVEPGGLLHFPQPSVARVRKLALYWACSVHWTCALQRFASKQQQHERAKFGETSVSASRGFS